MTRCLLSSARRFLPLLLAVGFIAAPALSHAAPPAVELTLLGVPKPADDEDNEKPVKPAGDENILPPTAAFELRFVSQMVAADQVGKEASDSPLVFTPSLPGASAGPASAAVSTRSPNRHRLVPATKPRFATA